MPQYNKRKYRKLNLPLHVFMYQFFGTITILERCQWSEYTVLSASCSCYYAC